MTITPKYWPKSEKWRPRIEFPNLMTSSQIGLEKIPKKESIKITSSIKSMMPSKEALRTIIQLVVTTKSVRVSTNPKLNRPANSLESISKK